MTILQIENLTKRFGNLTAVDTMDFTVRQDQISSVIGPNGAGKSTLFNLISGLLKPDEGRIYFQDVEITDLPPHQITRLGIGRSFQIIDIFEGLTVRENVRLATQSLDESYDAVWRRVESIDAPIKAADAILKDVGLIDYAESRADELSHGDRRKLDIALTMAVEPDLVLLDEPTAGMGKEESVQMVEMIRGLSESRDITLVLIEHDLEIVMEISDVVMVMHKGQKLIEDTPERVRANEDVQRAYLGTGEEHQ